MARALGPGFEAMNEGHPGRKTTHGDPMSGLHRNGIVVLTDLLESHMPLGLMVLKLGANELKNGMQVSPAEIAICPGRMVGQIRSILAAAKSEVLVGAPPPFLEAGCLAEMFGGGAAKSHGLARAIALMCARTGAGVFDAGKVIQVSSVDGIHDEAEARVALGLAMAEAVRQHLT